MIKKIGLLFGFALLMISCGTSKNVTPSTQKTRKSTTSNPKPTLADKIIWTAVTYKGVPYKYGGTTRSGMDCSGLIMVSFAERGVDLPRSSYDMSKEGYTISLREAQRGDLIFFQTNPRKPNTISHVGLVTHVKDGVAYFIHTSTKRGVTVNNMSERYYKNAFVKVKRVL